MHHQLRGPQITFRSIENRDSAVHDRDSPNHDSHYILMSQFDSLPEETRSKLKTDPRYTSGNELLPAEVASTMYEHERVIWTASQMESELETGHRTETVRDKLNKLDEVDVCRSMPANNGRIYWWNDERSKWPIPSDVVVEGQEELTVSELFNPWYAKLGILGLLGPLVAGIPLLIGLFVIDGAISVPIAAEELLTAGFVMIVGSYLVLIYAIVLGVVELVTGDKVNMSIFDAR